MRHANHMKIVDFQPGWDSRNSRMPGREIENVVFLGNTDIFDERKHMAFLPLLRPTQVLPNYITILLSF